MRILYMLILMMALPQVLDLRNYGCSASSHGSWLNRAIGSLENRKEGNNVIYFPTGSLDEKMPHAEPDYNKLSLKRPLFHSKNSPYSKSYNQSGYPKISSNAIWTDELSPGDLPFWEKFSHGESGLKESKVRKRNADKRSLKRAKLHRRKKRERKKNYRIKNRKNIQKKNKNRRKIQRRRSKKLDNFIEIEEDRGNSISRDNGDTYIECCPSEEVVRELTIGKDRDNHAVEIKNATNLFYERECLSNVEGNECTFPPRMVRKGYHTECVQKYSYTQAHVRSLGSKGIWRIDYIQVKSDCSCEIRVRPKKKRK